jgi:hypothetical protein
VTTPAVAQPAAPPGRRGLAWALFLLIWLLPFHAVVVAVLFGGLGLPGPVVRGIAAWKEALVAVLVGAVLIRVVLGRGQRTPVRWLDVAILGFALLSLPYFVSSGIWFGLDVPVGARVYGLRDLAFFPLVYFAGRSTPAVVHDERVLKALFVVGVVTSVAAVLERIFVTPEALVLLGVAAYFHDFLGATLWSLGNPYGLPANYWTMFGTTAVQRAGSTYLSSQGFAVSFLIIVPAATIWLCARKRSAAAWVGYGLLWLGLLLSVTRMTLIVCMLQAVAIAATRRRWGLIVAGGAACALAFGCALLLVPQLPTFLWETLTWQTGSSLSHLDAWLLGMENALRYPFGAGLGVADQAAVRFGLYPMAGDNVYLTYAVELGFVGLGLHLATIVGAGITGWNGAKAGHGVASDYAVVVAAVAAGILLNGITAVPFNSILLTCVFFWLLGSLVTRADLKDRP